MIRPRSHRVISIRSGLADKSPLTNGRGGALLRLHCPRDANPRSTTKLGRNTPWRCRCSSLIRGVITDLVTLMSLALRDKQTADAAEGHAGEDGNSRGTTRNTETLLTIEERKGAEGTIAHDLYTYMYFFDLLR